MHYTIIDMEKDPRCGQFAYFRAMQYPFASVTVEVDITDMMTARGSRPFFLSLLYAVVRAANAVPQAGEDGALDESWTENCLKLSGGTLTGAVAESLAKVTGEAVTLDLKAANNFTHNVTANTAFTVTANTGNSFQLGTLVLTNGGAFTVTWPSSFKWADGAPPSLMESGIDVITFFTINGGTTYYAAQAMTGIA